MNPPNTGYSVTMSLLNKWLQSLISLRGLLLISAILLLSGFIRPDTALVLERWYYQLGQRLSSPAPVATDIALIELEQEDLLQLQRDPGQSELLPLLLQEDALVALVEDTAATFICSMRSRCQVARGETNTSTPR